VRLGCQARALEGQIHVLQSPTVGAAPWSPALDINHGAAALYAPPDASLIGERAAQIPANGVLAIGGMDQPQWLFARIDIAALATLAQDGNVLTRRDWASQKGAQPLPPVEMVDLLPS
jgi:predicted amidohydrolase